jgi:hypothetical protein
VQRAWAVVGGGAQRLVVVIAYVTMAVCAIACENSTLPCSRATEYGGTVRPDLLVCACQAPPRLQPQHGLDQKCLIQWLYLAAHGCKTNLNLNLKTFRRRTEKVCYIHWAPI